MCRDRKANAAMSRATEREIREKKGGERLVVYRESPCGNIPAPHHATVEEVEDVDDVDEDHDQTDHSTSDLAHPHTCGKD